MRASKETFQNQVTAARKSQILEAAERVFARKGFHGATIRDVAKEAGIADGTIYNYFDNKQELIRGLLGKLQQEEGKAAAIGANANADMTGFIRGYLRRRMAFLMANLDLFRALLPELLTDPELQEMYYQQTVLPELEMSEYVLQLRTARGELHQNDEALVARTIVAATVGLLVLEIMGDKVLEARWNELPDLIARILSDGLAVE